MCKEYIDTYILLVYKLHMANEKLFMYIFIYHNRAHLSILQIIIIEEFCSTHSYIAFAYNTLHYFKSFVLHFAGKVLEKI